jgi:N-acetylglucosaminyl-diphospho-decaprenol L-rhamnosyltransferase
MSDAGDRSPDLAVVIVNYNTGEYLTRAVRSAYESAGDARLEVVVVDNASRDGSAEAALQAHPAVGLIQNGANRGFAAAVNQGIRASRAAFVLLLNPDAEVLAGTLGGFLKVAADHPRAGVIGPVVRDPDGSIYPSARKIPTLREALGHSFLHPFLPDNRFSRAYTMAGWDRRTERRVEWVSCSCSLLRREALEDVGLFDERFFMYVEDVDMSTRMRAAGWEVMFSPELEVVHVGGISTAGRKRMTVEHSRSIYKYFEKHRARGWRRALLPFAWVALRARAELVAWRRGER